MMRDFLGTPLAPGDLVFWGDLDGQSLARVHEPSPIGDEYINVYFVYLRPGETTRPLMRVHNESLAYHTADYKDLNLDQIAALYNIGKGQPA